MAVETLELGSTPYDEDCAQVGTPDYSSKARKECQRFIELLTKKFGKPPVDAEFRISTNPHDFGSYLEVIIKFNPRSEAETNYAYIVERNIPATWDDDTPVAIQSNEEI